MKRTSTRALRRSVKAMVAGCLVTALALSGCGGGDSAGGDGDKKLKVGYIVNFGSHEWYQNVIKGAKDTAAEKGIEFMSADANQDLAKQVSQSENFLTQGVNVLAMSPVDPKGLSSVMAKAKEKKVPVVTESNAIDGAATTVGIKNEDAAKMLGEWAGNYVKKNMPAGAKILIVGLPTQVDTIARVKGFKAGITASGCKCTIVQEVNGSGLKDKALQASADAITAHKDINVVFGINDDSALGGTQAYQEAGLDMKKLATFGFGVEGKAGKAALMAGGAYKAGLGMFPEYVGRTLIEQAVAANDGKTLEPQTVTPATVLTPQNLSQYYTKEGSDWKINFEAVQKLPKTG